MRLLIIFVIINFFTKFSNASDFNIIRDAEIENFLNKIANNLIDDSNLKNQNFKFFIDNKDYINASVIPGPKFFFTKKLLMESKSVDQIAGVIAHEIGHVVGGHFVKSHDAFKESSIINILSSIIAAGAIASGAPGAGTAILMGGQHISQANLLAFSRSQESFADQTAIRFLKKSGFSVHGLMEMFKLLERNEKFKQFNPYFLTHPLSSERIKNIEFHLDKKKTKDFAHLNKEFLLIKAKLNGFFLEEKELKLLHSDLQSIEDIYAYSLRFYKVGKVNEAIRLINKCIEYDPKNPYFRELKGQIYLESGKILEAIESFRNAIKIKPNEKGFSLFLAKSLYHQNTKIGYNESIDLLWSYIKKDEFPLDAWHYLGLNYGKLKKFDYSSYAFAEKYFLLNEIENAKIHIDKVKKHSKDQLLLKKISDLEYELKKGKQ